MVFSNKIWRQNQARTFDNKKQLIMKTRHVTIKTNVTVHGLQLSVHG